MDSGRGSVRGVRWLAPQLLRFVNHVRRGHVNRTFLPGVFLEVSSRLPAEPQGLAIVRANRPDPQPFLDLALDFFRHLLGLQEGPGADGRAVKQFPPPRLFNGRTVRAARTDSGCVTEARNARLGPPRKA